MEFSFMKYKDGIPFVAASYPQNQTDAILLEDLNLPYLIEYIRKKDIKKAVINEMYDFSFLKDCPQLEFIKVIFRLPFCAYDQLKGSGENYYYTYDLSPIYDLPLVRHLNITDMEVSDIHARTQVDLGRVKGLEHYDGPGGFVKNTGEALALKSIYFRRGYKEKNLQSLCKLEKLKCLGIELSRLESLEGIENLKNIKWLLLGYNRSLQDISALEKVKDTLEYLYIENCGKIKDFSVLKELPHLKKLRLMGKMTIPSLKFFEDLKELEYFHITGNVLDGDLTPCMKLHCAHCQDRRHYNIKDDDLPKGKWIPYEGIEPWWYLT